MKEQWVRKISLKNFQLLWRNVTKTQGGFCDLHCTYDTSVSKIVHGNMVYEIMLSDKINVCMFYFS